MKDFFDGICESCDVETTVYRTNDGVYLCRECFRRYEGISPITRQYAADRGMICEQCNDIVNELLEFENQRVCKGCYRILTIMERLESREEPEEYDYFENEP